MTAEHEAFQAKCTQLEQLKSEQLGYAADLMNEIGRRQELLDECIALLKDIPLTSKVKGGSMLIQRRDALVQKAEKVMRQEEEMKIADES